MKGRIFNVQHYSVHDGPGIRTIVFFKGCGLRCRWCSNPESQEPTLQLSYNEQHCIGGDCLLCQSVCQERAIFYPGQGAVQLKRERCTECQACAQICPAEALQTFGKETDVEAVLQEVQEDTVFYHNSHGGLTLSGGEVLLQPDFAAELLQIARERGIHTAIETCGYAPWEAAEKVFPNCDCILYDLKCMDEEKHKTYTGGSNQIILENFKKLKQQFPQIEVVARTPVIPSFNDNLDDLRKIYAFVKEYAPESKYELLKYHRYGENKYRCLGKDYPMGKAELDEETFNQLKSSL